MQYLSRGHPTRQLPVNVDIFAVDGRLDAHLCAAGLGPFIDAACRRNMRVLINNARRDVLSAGIDGIIFRRIRSKYSIRV